MLQGIIRFSIKNKLVVLVFTAAMIAYGVFQLTLLPIDAVPDITDNQVQVITVSPSLGAPDIERFITFPIEQANNNIPGLKEIRSFSRFGLSVVTIVFHDDIDVYWARQQVSERLQRVQSELPPGLGTPGLAPVTTGLGEIYQYVLRPMPGYEQKYSPVELRTMQDWIVRRQLLGVPGVADVSTFGGLLKQYEVSVIPDRLKSHQITINDVFNALEANNQNAGGAYIEKGPTVLFIRSEGLVGQLSDIEQVVVKSTSTGIPVKISDVATVGYGTATRYGAVCYNDEGEVAGAVVMMLKGENSSAVIKRVKDRIAEIQKALPEGVLIEPFLDRTKMVNNAISTVETNLLEGALIVVFVLVLFLGNLRAGLLVASVIPLSMLIAVILMNMFGVSGNLMSLGALDFGLIVDGAVIIVEAVMHQLSHSKTLPHTETARLTQAQMDTQVEKSASRMMNAAVFGQIIILVVYLPIFALEGIEGKMFKPMAQTVAFALLGAFVMSLTFIPAMSTLALSKKATLKPSFSDRMMGRIERMFQKRLSQVLQFPKIAIASAVFVFVVALLVLNKLGGEFIPELEEGDFAVDTRVLMGSNLGTTISFTQQTAKILLDRFPEVEKVVTKIGSGEIPTDPMPIEASDMMVILKDKKQWTSARTFDEMAEKMGAALKDVPGITAGFQYPVQMRFNELMTGAKQDVVCKIFGENLDTLASLAARLGNLVENVNGATEIYVESVTGMPQILIKHRRAALAQYGLSVETVNQTVNAAFAGAVAGQVFEDEKRFDLVVRLASQERRRLEDVQNLTVETPAGLQVPLNHLADVQVIEGPNQIQRENAQRRIVVGFNVRGKDVQTVVNELGTQVAEKLKFPAGYFITYGGSFENLQAAKARLGIAVPVALLLIFLMLYFAFGSLQQGLLICSAIPLSAVGGILALALFGMPFSISAGIGFIALFGVAVLNGIVLITEFNRLKKEGMDDLRRVVLQGTKIRLRPVLMTATVASLGFLPMAFSQGAGAEVQRPLATVVIGGLITATLLTLFLLPVLYVYFGQSKPPKIAKKVAVVLGFSMALNPSLYGQIPISLEAAIDSAIRNHPSLRPHTLNVTQFQTLQRTARDLPKMDLTIESGQINSYYWDNRLAASQAFNPRKVTKARAAMLENQTSVGRAALDFEKKALAFEVAKQYAEIGALIEKETVLHFADSLYEQASKRAINRLRAGESNALEKANIELERSRTARQLKQVQSERETLIAQFNRFIGSTQTFEPVVQKFTLINVPAFSELSKPLLEPLIMETSFAQSQIKVASTELTPQYRLGIGLQAIRGVQQINSEEMFFGSTPQFLTLQAGMNLPVFKKAANARIQASIIERDIAQARLSALTYELETKYKQAVKNFETKRDALLDFERHTQAVLITVLQTADKQLANGAVNYLEWLMSVKQIIDARLEYAELLNQYNQSIINLTHFSR
ncbi:MAG: CusA/CzcA family heavy metal efflux RND transporter [Saprospiraceae bacterium]|nr:CusA/CzcA family heavy metal efflux RND transporter [Saprospiraceae bacterium]